LSLKLPRTFERELLNVVEIFGRWGKLKGLTFVALLFHTLFKIGFQIDEVILLKRQLKIKREILGV